MEAHKNEGRPHGLTASAVVIPGEGDGSGVARAVTVRVSTPALVVGVVSVGVMTWGFRRLQGAELALVENDSDPLPQRPEPH
jgi:hypothetical protein